MEQGEWSIANIYFNFQIRIHLPIFFGLSQQTRKVDYTWNSLENIFHGCGVHYGKLESNMATFVSARLYGPVSKLFVSFVMFLFVVMTRHKLCRERDGLQLLDKSLWGPLPSWFFLNVCQKAMTCSIFIFPFACAKSLHDGTWFRLPDWQDVCGNCRPSLALYSFLLHFNCNVVSLQVLFLCVVFITDFLLLITINIWNLLLWVLWNLERIVSNSLKTELKI